MHVWHAAPTADILVSFRFLAHLPACLPGYVFSDYVFAVWL